MTNIVKDCAHNRHLVPFSLMVVAKRFFKLLISCEGVGFGGEGDVIDAEIIITTKQEYTRAKQISSSHKAVIKENMRFGLSFIKPVE